MLNLSTMIKKAEDLAETLKTAKGTPQPSEPALAQAESKPVLAQEAPAQPDNFVRNLLLGAGGGGAIGIGSAAIQNENLVNRLIEEEADKNLNLTYGKGGLSDLRNRLSRPLSEFKLEPDFVKRRLADIIERGSKPTALSGIGKNLRHEEALRSLSSKPLKGAGIGAALMALLSLPSLWRSSGEMAKQSQAAPAQPEPNHLVRNLLLGAGTGGALGLRDAAVQNENLVNELINEEASNNLKTLQREKALLRLHNRFQHNRVQHNRFQHNKFQRFPYNIGRKRELPGYDIIKTELDDLMSQNILRSQSKPMSLAFPRDRGLRRTNALESLKSKSLRGAGLGAALMALFSLPSLWRSSGEMAKQE